MDKYNHDSNMDLESVMQERYIPAPSSNLAERIIEASLMHQKQGRSGFDLWWRTFWDAFLLPKPAYVIAVIFVLGLFMGLYTEIASAGLDEPSAAEMVYTAEGVTEGDWL